MVISISCPDVRIARGVSSESAPSVDRTHLVGKDHETPIGFTTQNTSYTLCGMSHGIESEVIVFSYPVIIPKEFESRFQYTTLGILVWDTKHDDRSAVVTTISVTTSCVGVTTH
jgi:hypothetical protein